MSHEWLLGHSIVFHLIQSRLRHIQSTNRTQMTLIAVLLHFWDVNGSYRHYWYEKTLMNLFQGNSCAGVRNSV